MDKIDNRATLTGAPSLAVIAALTFELTAIFNFAPAVAQSPAPQPANVNVLLLPPEQASGPAIDYVRARPRELPIASDYSPSRAQLDVIRALATPQSTSMGGLSAGQFSQLVGSERGRIGSGKQNKVVLGTPMKQSQPAPTTPEEFGTAQLPFSTARADLDPIPTNDQWPYRAAGKLFFLIGNETFVCSASLIKRGLVVTAAHCVAEFGKRQYFSGFRFVPGYRDGVAPYGTWTAAQVRILDSYYNGTDECAQSGVVCRSDIAVIALNSQRDADNSSYYAGTNTGWYGYGWNADGFTPRGMVQVTQLGYPLCLDDGAFMERNDSQGFTSAEYSRNTVAGSLMCGGSSGGPWLINFGVRPNLTGTTAGTGAQENLVIGVTSWGSTNNAVKQMGASPFLSSNIGELVRAACNATPDACN